MSLWARDGDTAVMFCPGRPLRKGANGIESSPTRSVEVLMCAIKESRHTGCMFNLGARLVNGASSTEPNPARSAELWSRAIEKGRLGEAMINLASILEQGAMGIALSSHTLRLYSEGKSRLPSRYCDIRLVTKPALKFVDDSANYCKV